MRIFVATEPADFRRGIDGLAALCRQRLEQDPMNGCAFVFRNRRGTAIKILLYDGQGFWLCQKRLSQGRFRHWPTGETPTRAHWNGIEASADVSCVFSARQSGGLHMAAKAPPAVTQLYVQELEMILDEVEQALGAEKAQKLRQLLNSHETLTQLIREKNISLARLRRILFGPQTERTRDAAGGQKESPREGTNDTAPPDE
jgi:hypothetical protein